jgi:UDP-N-acetylglucosamine acyltransferase
MSVHTTAVVHPHARLAPGVSVGPYCVIGEKVEIAEGTDVMSHVTIEGDTKIGRGNRIFPHAAIGCIPQDLKFAGEESRVEIGDDNSIREFVTIHRGTAGGHRVTRIGSHNLLMAYVHIAHDCVMGDHVIMSNAATLAGHVEVQDYAQVGAFSAVHQFCRVGTYGFIGGFTVVTQDVLPFSKTTAPRPIGVYGANTIGLERRGLNKEDVAQLQAAIKLICRSKLNTTQALEAIEARGLNSPHVKTLVEFIKTSERGVIKGTRRGRE